MVPTIPTGHIFWANRLIRLSPDKIKRGDVILYRQQIEEREEIHAMRVMGLPGDTVELREDAVVVNGMPLTQTSVRQEGEYTRVQEQAADVAYEIYLRTAKPFSQRHEVVKVPESSFYVLGDNRYHARDSRYTGFVTFKRLVARKL